MADSLLDIGAEPVFPLEPNWISTPKQSFNITRYLNQYPGTISEISEMNPEVPISLEAEFDLKSKEDEFTFITFIHTHLGRCVRFWFRWPKTLFTVKDPMSNGSVGMVVHKDNSSLSLQGYERIYILLTNGDVVTRHITNAVLDDANNEVELTMATALDRDIALADIDRVGRFLLVRFDEDLFRLKIINDHKSTVNLRFQELVKEYAELAANP
jgi:hypothetical protein